MNFFDLDNQSHGKTNPIKVKRMAPIIDRCFNECDPLQFLREIIKNAIEAGATYCELRPYWPDLFASKTCHLMFADNGCGMAPDKLIEFFENYGHGSKEITVFGGNFGVGAKVSLLPWNQSGVLVASWVDGIGHAIKIWRDPEIDDYGLYNFKVQDGFTTELLEIGDELKPNCIDQHGTMIVLFGNEVSDHTWFGPKNHEGNYAAESTLGLLSWINNKFFRLPAQFVNFFQLKKNPDEWPTSFTQLVERGSNDSHTYVTSRYGAGYESFLLDGSLQSGTLVSDNDEFKIHWYWLKEKKSWKSALDSRPEEVMANIPYVHQGKMIASLYDNEIYDRRIGKHTNSLFGQFGIYKPSIYRRVVLLVEPKQMTEDHMSGVFCDTTRSYLISPSLKNMPKGKQLPWDEYGDFFRANMPQVIKDAQEASLTNDDHNLNDLINDDLKDLLESMTRKGYKKDPNGKKKIGGKTGNIDGPGGDEPGVIAVGTGGNGGGSSVKPANTGPGNVRATRTRNRRNPPYIEPVNGNEEDLVDRIARYDFTSHRILFNVNYWLVEDTVIQTSVKYNCGDDEAKFKEITKTVHRVFGKKLVEQIFHHQLNKNTENWTRTEWEESLSPEALTMSIHGSDWISNEVSRLLSKHGIRMNKKSKKKAKSSKQPAKTTQAIGKELLETHREQIAYHRSGKRNKVESMKTVFKNMKTIKEV